ncbi:MAG: STAS domain-containing protein [Nitrospiraceae bacterium]|nr:STAS domain-containing protein [Nitrospiraceae bacterium]
MNIKQHRNGDREIISVSGAATVAEAASLKQVLLSAFQQAGEVELTFEAIGDADLTVLQLLCSAHRSAADHGKKLVVKGLDQEPLVRLIGQMGFTRHVGCRETTRTTCFWLCKQGAH